MAGYYRLKEVMASALTCTKSDLLGIAVKDYHEVTEFLMRFASPVFVIFAGMISGTPLRRGYVNEEWLWRTLPTHWVTRRWP